MTSTNQHPLLHEIAGLKAAVARYQDETHSASIKLQRFSLDTSNAHDRLVVLERENALLREELSVLRKHDYDKDQAPSQSATIQDLTLSLRKLSERLSLTEDTLAERTTQCANFQGEISRAKRAEQDAYALAARSRGREEEGKSYARQLELDVRAANERVTMADVALNEYANLVRSMEKGNSSASSSSSLPTSPTPGESMDACRAELDRVVAEFAADTQQLHAEIARLNETLALEQARANVEIKAVEEDRAERARAIHELEKYQLDDRTATKMVSRYMKFSQMSTNALQESLETMKARHSATVNTLSTQVHTLSSQLSTSTKTSDKLRDALDELGKELIKEGFGRRREVALRIKMLSREEQLEEGLRRLVRRAEESRGLERMVLEASKLLETMGTGIEGLSTADARLVAAQSALEQLTEEMQELAERKYLLHESDSSEYLANGHGYPHINGNEKPLLRGQVLPAPGSPASPTDEEILEHGSDKPNPIIVVSEVPEKADDSPESSAPSVCENVSIPSKQGQQEAEEIASVPVSAPATLPSQVEHIQQQQHPFIAELRHVGNRYDDLQRSFRDCQLALQQLKDTLGADNANGSHGQSGTTSSLPLINAVERLNDYTEDARVELEIRVADEVLVARGFETLLSLSASDHGHEADTESESMASIHAFISGEDANVRKARANLERKLGDVQHDIAILKQYLHEQEYANPAVSSSLPSSNGSSQDVPLHQEQPLNSSGPSWFGRISTSSRPASPAPTFGDVISSPSQHSLRTKPSYSRLTQSLRIAPPAPPTSSSPFPSHNAHNGFGIGQGVPSVSLSNGNGDKRTRKTSTMYMLGLGRASSPSQQRNGTGLRIGSSASLPTPAAVSEVHNESEDVKDDVE